MSKPPYEVFEPVGFTEPVPGLRRRPVAVARSAPIVELVEAGEPRWSATLPPEELELELQRDAAPATTRGRAAPLATGAVLLAMAGAGWAMLQAQSKPVLEIPPLAELAMPAARVSSTALSVAPAAVPEKPVEKPAAPAIQEPVKPAAEASPAKPSATPSATPPAKPTAAAPTRTAALKPSQGDLMKSLPAPAAGQTSPTREALPPAPSAMPTSPLTLPATTPAATPASAPAESKPESKPEAPAVAAPPQPPASAASASAA